MLRTLTLAAAASLAFTTAWGRADEQKPQQNTSEVRLWAGLGVTSPVIWADDVADPQFFAIFFSMVNDGKKTVNPEIDSSRLFINGKELKDWGFIVGNGPRTDDFEALAPGECLQFTKAMGNYFTEPGIYKVKWKGKAFESSDVVFRVLPKKTR